MESHERILGYMRRIGAQAAEYGNGAKLAEAVRGLSQELRQYGDLVDEHKVRRNGGGFLEFPYSRGESFLGVDFNPQTTLNGLKITHFVRSSN